MRLDVDVLVRERRHDALQQLELRVLGERLKARQHPDQVLHRRPRDLKRTTANVLRSYRPLTPNSHRVHQRITHAKVTAHQNGSHMCPSLCSH